MSAHQKHPFNSLIFISHILIRWVNVGVDGVNPVAHFFNGFLSCLSIFTEHVRDFEHHDVESSPLDEAMVHWPILHLPSKIQRVEDKWRVFLPKPLLSFQDIPHPPSLPRGQHFGWLWW